MKNSDLIESSILDQVMCRSCGQLLHPSKLNFGPQPLCNRFLSSSHESEFLHPLIMGVCQSCGLFQNIDAPPAKEIAPQSPWITYNEPEGHLDTVTEQLLEIAASEGHTNVGGVSYKDDTTLKRLRVRGNHAVWRVTPEELGLQQSKVEIETVQDCLTADRGDEITKHRGKADMLIVRHIVEHAHDLKTFLAAVKSLVQPNGVVVFEVPDCTATLAFKDYSVLWEEHLFYYTPATLKTCLEQYGFEVFRMENYKYPLENSLVVFARPCRKAAALSLTTGKLDPEVQRALCYMTDFPLARQQYRQILNNHQKQGQKIVLLGAGHLACSFVNLMGLQEYVDCILDDDQNRQGMLMPGSHLAIKASSFLNEPSVALCLLSLNPLNEDKVIAKQQQFVQRGGEFRSIFPTSKHALLNAEN